MGFPGKVSVVVVVVAVVVVVVVVVRMVQKLRAYIIFR